MVIIYRNRLAKYKDGGGVPMKGGGMINLHPEFLTKEGRREFAVLPYEEFVILQELLEDAEDVLDLRAAKQEEKDSLCIPLEDVKKELGMS
jgi:hypothetical protein